MKCISKAAGCIAAALVLCGSFAGCANAAAGTTASSSTTSSSSSSSTSFTAQTLTLSATDSDITDKLGLTPGAWTSKDTSIVTASVGTENKNDMIFESVKAGTTTIICTETIATGDSNIHIKYAVLNMTVSAAGAITWTVNTKYTSALGTTSYNVPVSSLGLTPTYVKSSNQAYIDASYDSSTSSVLLSPRAVTNDYSGKITITCSDTSTYTNCATIVVAAVTSSGISSSDCTVTAYK